MYPRKKGFTLIELLVVISIIALLSSILIASLVSARQKAKEAALTRQAQEMFKIIEGSITSGDYANWLAHWAGYFGDQDCDNTPSFLNAADRASLTAVCHSLFRIGGYIPIGSDTTRPFLISIQQRLSAAPSQRGYPAAYGITMLTNEKMICVGTIGGVSSGEYNILYNPNTSCYYSPPIVAP